MSTIHNLYTVGTTDAVLVSSTDASSSRDITIQNANLSGYIYVGGEGLSNSNYGYRLLPDHAISFELEGQDELYVLASGSNMKVAVISINLESEGRRG